MSIGARRVDVRVGPCGTVPLKVPFRTDGGKIGPARAACLFDLCQDVRHRAAVTSADSIVAGRVSMQTQSVQISMDGAEHAGDLALPANAPGIVLFAHGSGSGRLSPRNRFVAEALQREGVATLLFDLLTETEDRAYRNRFDIALLTRRLTTATRWARGESATAGLVVGYFGASTGAAAALCAAAALPDIKAVVSRGGRPDLAIDVLPRVRAATLLIVGGDDDTVLALNRDAYARLAEPRGLEIIPGATHLFEESGALEEVARLAGVWFRRYLGVDTPA